MTQTADEESLAQKTSRFLFSNPTISLVMQKPPSEHSRKNLRIKFAGQNTTGRSFTNNAG
jgi:hypothetical protein